MESEDQQGLSDTETLYYDDEDIAPSDEQISEINWRDLFAESLRNIPEKRLTHAARPLSCPNDLKVRLSTLFDRPLKFPLSDGICSRLICEYGQPLPLSNKYQFCGSKILNSAWKLDGNLFDFPLSFTSSIRSLAFGQLHLDHSQLHEHFELKLEKLLLFGQCNHAKLYNFDRELFIYHATILVFLPSNSLGGQYRFIDDNENTHRHIFSREANDLNPYLLVVPSDCEHEIEAIEKGFNAILVYHLISKTNSIPDLYSRLWQSSHASHSLDHLLTYWKTHLPKLPNKLLIPMQHPSDYSSYYSFLFREKYRTFLQLLFSSLQPHASSFTLYSAHLYYDQGIVHSSLNDSRLFIKHLHRLNSQRNLDFDSEHERTVLAREFLGDVQPYLDGFEEGTAREIVLKNNQKVLRNDLRYHIILLLPNEYQWDLFLDQPANAYHHLSYMLSLNYFNTQSLQFFECILKDQTQQEKSLEKLIEYLFILLDRCGPTRKIDELAKIIFQTKQFQGEFFSNSSLLPFINRLATLPEFFDFFRQSLSQAMPVKLTEIVHFLLAIHDRTFRALFVNSLLRFVFRKRLYPHQVLFSSFCSIVKLLILDRSYSTDALLTYIAYLIKRVRRLSSPTDVIDKYFKVHFIPLLIEISRARDHPLPAPFFLLYQFCLNTLEYYCSLPVPPPNTLVSRNETLLICPCSACSKFKDFLTDAKQRVYSPKAVDACLTHTLQQFQSLAIAYHEEDLTISKCGNEEAFKQLCLYLRHALLHLKRL